MRKNIIATTVFTALIFSGILLAGCTEKTVKVPGTPLNQIDKSFLKGNTLFGLNTYMKIVEAENDKNIIFSPLSLSLALGMTYNGARGETKTSFEQTLGLRQSTPDSPPLTYQKVNADFSGLMQGITDMDKSVKLSMANSLWVRKDFTLDKAFTSSMKSYYSAGIESLDFAKPGSKDTINKWVENKTDGNIKELVSDLDNTTVLILINAIFFKGTWQTPFMKENTIDNDFTPYSGSTKKVKMMYNIDKYEYKQNADYQAVRLPYGKDGKFLMTVYLPAKDKKISQLLTGITTEKWDALQSGFANKKGTVGLPRFKAEYKMKLNDILSSLGLGIAFDMAKADLQNIAKTPGHNLFIALVLQKAMIDVTEEGTTAAAATSVSIAVTSMAPDKNNPPFRMIMDRPFFYTITEASSGTILFMGQMVNPN